jgi:hypothetical protein
MALYVNHTVYYIIQLIAPLWYHFWIGNSPAWSEYEYHLSSQGLLVYTFIYKMFIAKTTKGNKHTILLIMK